MPVLTPQQLEAIQALEWLYDPGAPQRRTGRSLVTAIAMIRLALRYPGQSINLRDHITGRGPRSAAEVALNISRILDDDPLLQDAFLVRNARLTFNADELAPLGIDPSTWLPQGWIAPDPTAVVSQGRNLAVLGGTIENIPTPTPEPKEPESTLWDYVQDPTF